jgi:hypothetical protein
MPAATFQVTQEQTKDFASVYRINGIYIPLAPEHIQFATDWSNIVLKNFIEQCQQKAAAVKAPPAPEKSRIIMEGID